MIKPWTIQSSQQVIKDQYISLRTDRCIRAGGQIVPTFHVLEYTDWVTLIPLTDAGEIILIREYRHAAGKVMLGLPGGVSDPGESDWAAVGARELAEETGYTAQELVPVGSCHPNAATQNNLLHYFLALGCEQTSGQKLDPNEEIEVVRMPYEDFLAYEGLDVQHGLHAAALFYAERYFQRRPDLRPSAP